MDVSLGLVESKMADQDDMLLDECTTNGEAFDIILAYDEEQNMAHSITRPGEIGPKDLPVSKNKSRKTWNSKILKRFSKQLLKPFATISSNNKDNRPPLSDLHVPEAISSMKRQMFPLPPVPTPQTNGHEQYDGEEPEDDYSDFNAWGNDFDDHEAEEEYDNPDDLHRPAPGPHGPHHPAGMFDQNQASVPRLPPARQLPIIPPPESDNAPPPIIPRHGGARVPQPRIESERSSDPPPSLPSRDLPSTQDSDEDEHPSLEYLEPSEATLGRQPMQTLNDVGTNYLVTDNLDQDTYEDPETFHQAPPPAPTQSRNQDDSMDIYLEPDESNTAPPLPAMRINKPPPAQDSCDIYEDADEPPQQLPPPRKNFAQRQLPVPPKQSLLPRQPLPRIPVHDQEQLSTSTAMIPITTLSQRTLPPEPVVNDRLTHLKHAKANGPSPVMVRTLKLREAKDGLRPVNTIFTQEQEPDLSNNNNDSEDKGVTNLGVAGIIAKLSSQTSSSRDNRKLPQPPAPSSSKRPTIASSHSNSDDNSSGSGTIPFRQTDRLPQPPPQTRFTPHNIDMISNIPVEQEHYYHEIDRTETEKLLSPNESMFLVRSSKLGGSGQPYTLCMYHMGRIWNLKIRRKKERCYALGTEHGEEKTFTSVTELVNYHQKNPITLANGGQVKLGITPHEDIYDGTC